MSRVKQVLILNPSSELHFKGPFNDIVTSYLKLTNPSERRVCYKVKTTNPRLYCVRPNTGLIEPFDNKTIALMLRPLDLDNLKDKHKQKFLVQTVYAPEGEVNQEKLWKEVEPKDVMESKLKCVFDVSVTPTETGGQTSTTTETSINANISLTNNVTILQTIPLMIAFISGFITALIVHFIFG